MRHRKPLQVIVISILALMLCSSLCFARFCRLKGASMEPTIKKEHFVWISNYEKNKNPVRGDIIIFFPVREEKEKYLKRVIGLPNETVIIKEGTVYLKNKENSKRKKLDEPYLAPKTVTEPNGEFQVPGGQYFILGDNRGHSDDSRRFGCIPRKDIIGKVTKIF